MPRSVLVPSVLVCLGLAVAGVAQPRDTAQPDSGPSAATADLAVTVKALEQRVALLEHQLSAQMKEATLGPTLIPFLSVTANLRDEGLKRFLRLRLVLVVEDGQKQAVLDALTEVRSKVKDWLLSQLSDKTIDDVRGLKNLNKIREEILAGVNVQFKSAGYPEYIKDVLYDEFNVQ